MSAQRVSAREAFILVNEQGYSYLDVRAAPEFATGHPQGAYNVPLLQPSLGGGTELNQAFIAEVSVLFDTDAKLVVGCATGVRSQTACEALRDAGFLHVVEQRSGMDGVRDPFGRVREKGYRAEGLPVATQAEPGRSHAEIKARIRSER